MTRVNERGIIMRGRKGHLKGEDIMKIVFMDQINVMAVSYILSRPNIALGWSEKTVGSYYFNMVLNFIIFLLKY